MRKSWQSPQKEKNERGTENAPEVVVRGRVPLGFLLFQEAQLMPEGSTSTL